MSRLLVLAMALMLSACGLSPLYSGGSQGVAGQMLGTIEVPAIPGKAGWLMRDALTRRFGAVPQGETRYRLDVELDDQITGLGVRRDDAVTRERRILRARYKLVELATDKVILDATSGSDAGIDVISSEYATVAAENSALERLSDTVADQIVARLAQLAASQAPTHSGAQ